MPPQSNRQSRGRKDDRQEAGTLEGELTLTNMLANIFGSSPVVPLEKHVNIAFKAVRNLGAFFEAVIDDEWDAASKIRDKINQLEHDADDLKKEIRVHLPKSLFMPVPREDLLELLLVQDKMANLAKDITGIVLGRKMTVPDELSEQFMEFLERNIDASRQARKSVRELDELFTTGFRGAEAELVAALVEELDAIETDTDDKQAALRGNLYKLEKELNPVDVMFLYKVIEMTGEIADMAERVGRRLELLLSH